MTASQSTPRCTQCVMDDSVPDITFDEHGVCNYCRSARERLAREYFGDVGHRDKLDALVAQVKHEGLGRPYDCIIGVSGGVDSSYVAYLVHELGLRALAIHFDNGWNSDLAVRNIEVLLKALDIDLYTHVVDWEEFRDLQLAFLRSSLANSEIPTDHAIIALLYRMAAKYGVRFILHGGNLATESIMPAVWMENALDLRLLRSVHRRFGSRKLRTYPTMGLGRLLYYTFVKRIRYVGLLNYIRYDKEAGMALLENRFGWRRYEAKHFESIFTRWFQGYLLPKKYGIDKRLAHLSSLIVSGQLTREEALARLNAEPYDVQQAEDDVIYVRRKFGLSVEEFAAMMAAPPRTTADYASNGWLWRALKPFVKRGKAIATGRVAASVGNGRAARMKQTKN